MRRRDRLGRSLLAVLAAVSLLAGAASAAGPEVSVGSLSGEPKTGELKSLSRQGAVIVQGGMEVKIPLTELMEVRLAKPGTPVAIPESAATVKLVDGSLLPATKVSLTRRECHIDSPLLGEIRIPSASVASIRFAPADTQVDSTWNELGERALKQDLLVVQKGMVLDHLDGTVGEVTSEKVSFVVDGDEIPLPREKVFGLILKRGKAPSADPLCEATFPGGGRLNLRLINWDDGEWQAALMAGGEIRLKADRIAALDFSAGKVKYLSDLKPREVRYYDFFDMLIPANRKLIDRGNGVQATAQYSFPWNEIHFDCINEGRQPLYLGGRKHERGLWMHSHTEAKFRIDGDYRRFQAVIGISDYRSRNRVGDATVTIRGDGKQLFAGPVHWSDDPKTIDLDVEGIRDIEIVVGFGNELDTSDHVIFGSAKFLK